MTRLERLADWYAARGAWPRTFLNAGFAFLVFYLGSIGEQAVQNDYQGDRTTFWIVRAVAIFCVFLVYFLVGIPIRTFLRTAEHQAAERRRCIAYAHSLIDQFVAGEIAHTRNISGAPLTDKPGTALWQALVSRDRLNDVVKNVYSLFESFYGQSHSLSARIDFEATFITQSYVDDELTIAAWANRNGRSPTSLNYRAKDRELYRKTEANKLYNDPRPILRIVPDTSKPNERYDELYPGQKEHLRSCVVFPVLSDSSTVLGVLVVHCDQTEFFQEEDRKYWTELLEIFGKRLALERARLDLLKEKGPIRDMLMKECVELPF